MNCLIFVSSILREISIMNNQQLYEKFSEISTPLVADACLRLNEYLTHRSTYASYTFRQHLRSIGGAIEE